MSDEWIEWMVEILVLQGNGSKEGDLPPPSERGARVFRGTACADHSRSSMRLAPRSLAFLALDQLLVVLIRIVSRTLHTTKPAAPFRDSSGIAVAPVSFVPLSASVGS